MINPQTDYRFYKTFCNVIGHNRTGQDVIGQDLTEGFNSCYKSQLQQREAVKRRIPKKGERKKKSPILNNFDIIN